MTDIRHIAKTAVPIVVVVVLLNLVWRALFFTSFFGNSVAWALWLFFVVCVGSVVYLTAGLVLMLFEKLLRVKYLQAKSDEALIYWFVMLASGLIVFYRLPQVHEEILAIVFNLFGFAQSNILQRAGLRLTPFADIGIYVWIFYFALGFTLVGRFIVGILADNDTVWQVFKSLRPVLIMMAILIALSSINLAWFSIYRLWLVFLLLQMWQLGKLLNKELQPLLKKELLEDGTDTKAFQIKRIFSKAFIIRTDYSNKVDNAVILTLYVTAFVMQIAVLITTIIYVFRMPV